VPAGKPKAPSGCPPKGAALAKAADKAADPAAATRVMSAVMAVPSQAEKPAPGGRSAQHRDGQYRDGAHHLWRAGGDALQCQLCRPAGRRTLGGSAEAQLEPPARSAWRGPLPRCSRA
jgi:hypothetical protein